MKLNYTDARARAKNRSQPYHFRGMDSVPFMLPRIPPEFQRLFHQRVIPDLKIHGYKQDQKIIAAMQCGFSALTAAIADKVVADTRNTHKRGIRTRVEAWKLLEDAGYVRKCLGSEKSGKVTRYKATQKFTALREEWTPELIHERKKISNGPLLGLIVFKRKMDDDGPTEVPYDRALLHYTERNHRGEPDPGGFSTAIAVARVQEEIINRINSVNLDHAWKTRNNSGVVYHPNVELVEMHIGELWRGVRYYTRGRNGGQNISKEERARLTIDGEATVELDFSGSVLRLAYHLRKLDVPAADVYQPERIAAEVWKFCNAADRKAVRAFIKTATQICLNVNCHDLAIRTVRAERQKRPAEWPLSSLPEPAELVSRIAQVHHAVARDLFANRGMQLVTTEGRIMFHILRELVLRARKPALAIHDGLRVKEQDEKLALGIMQNVYRHHTAFLPVISTK